MSKTSLTVFICTSKDCSKAWNRLCDSSPGKWLKHHLEEAGVSGKVRIVKTDCMDRCKHAACVGLVGAGGRGIVEEEIESHRDLERLLASVREIAGEEWNVRVGSCQEFADKN